MWASLVGLVLGAKTSYMGLWGGGVFNKCSQHCFLHPVWLHFSPKSNQNCLSSSLAYWMKCLILLGHDREEKDLVSFRGFRVEIPSGMVVA